MSDMAEIFKQCLFLLVICSWQVTNLASVCIDKCACTTNITMCQTCSYNITLTENRNTKHQISVCCNEIPLSSPWIQKFAPKTLAEVTVAYYTACNMSKVDFNAPLLDTFSLRVNNNSFAEISINIKRRNLREVDLSANNLQFVNKGLFNNFSNLRKLVLNKNKIVSIFEESFNGLSKLETLDLSENNLKILLLNIFTPLKNLQHLNLSRNNLEYIQENYFNNWLLQHLDVSHNNLRKLAPGALQLLPNLARLLLTDNPHLGLTQLDTQLLVGTGRRLQQIDASRTGLYQVPEAFTHSVRFLSLVGNKITAVRCGDFDSYPLLQSLDFSDNKVATVEDDSLGRLEMLLFLNMNRNLLTYVPKSLPDDLKYLSINNNMIKNLSSCDFKNLPNLRILLLQANNIRFIENHVFDDLLSLEMLDLSNNPIQALSWSTFDGPLSLRDLRLCNLNMSVPERDGSFPMSSPESVQMLHLQSSPGLARQLLADSAALAAFSHLQYLDLRANNLTEIRNDLLFYLAQLKTLRLHGNKINCTAELWLKDWMNYNNSLTNGETCYYSTSEAKADIAKYNCTFSETFTISDSLPPVNLYSTEMINKLLRYYGYLSNKTEKLYKNGSNKNKYAVNNIRVNDSAVTTLKEIYKNNEITQNKFPTNDYSNIYNRKSSKILAQNKNRNDQVNIDHRLPLEQYSVTARNHKKAKNDSVHRNKFSRGIRLNTPLNIKKDVEHDTEISNENSDTVKNIKSVIIHEKNSSDPNYKTEYSPFQSANHHYAQYAGTVAVVGLIIMSLILWVSFHLRYRRKRVPVIHTGAEDQIEVSNISGGVLW